MDTGGSRPPAPLPTQASPRSTQPAPEGPWLDLPQFKKWDELSSLLSTIPDTLPALCSLVAATAQLFTKRRLNIAADLARFFENSAKSFQRQEGDGVTIDDFVKNVVPGIIRYALRLPELFPEKRIPLFPQNRQGSVTFTRVQTACLLSNAFFCTFESLGETYPGFNFTGLYHSTPALHESEKLVMLLNYFDQVVQTEPKGKVRFERRSVAMDQFPKFVSSTKPLVDVVVEPSKSIEDCVECLQVDFANMYLGGGCLGGGCVQEEIKFAVCPELICGCLIFERMERNEAILMLGAEQYSKYEGYAFTLRYGGKYKDTNPLTTCGEFINSELCAIDAMDYRMMGEENQYRVEVMNREIQKAYVGFLGGTTPVATGNWGCGAFLGNKKNKSILQWIACSEVGRPMIYCTFGDQKLSKEMEIFMKKVQDAGVNVGQLYQMLIQVSEKSDPWKGILEQLEGANKSNASCANQ